MKLALLGDMAFIGQSSTSNKNYKNYFSEVSDLLGKYDYVVGNLESPFSVKKKTHGAKSAYICASPNNIDIIKMLHVNALTIANNHMLDYGKEGYELTKSILNEAKISWFGADGKELKVEIDDNRLAFSGWCCYSSNPQGCVKNGKNGINEFDLKTVVNNLIKNHNDNRLNIAAIHTGIEHVNFPSLELREVTKVMAETCPIIFYGHHPHVAQPIERKGDSIIAYSMGNFCFDNIYAKPTDKKPFVSLSENNRSSFVMVVDIEKNRIKGYDIIPIYIDKDKIKVGVGVTKEKLDNYLSMMLTMNEIEYEAMRLRQRKDWIDTRQKERNITWYIKRMRPRYMKLLITNHENQKKYYQCITSQLKKNEL